MRERGKRGKEKEGDSTPAIVFVELERDHFPCVVPVMGGKGTPRGTERGKRGGKNSMSRRPRIQAVTLRRREEGKSKVKTKGGREKERPTSHQAIRCPFRESPGETAIMTERKEKEGKRQLSTFAKARYPLPYRERRDQKGNRPTIRTRSVLSPRRRKERAGKGKKVNE